MTKRAQARRQAAEAGRRCPAQRLAGAACGSFVVCAAIATALYFTTFANELQAASASWLSGADNVAGKILGDLGDQARSLRIVAERLSDVVEAMGEAPSRVQLEELTESLRAPPSNSWTGIGFSINISHGERARYERAISAEDGVARGMYVPGGPEPRPPTPRAPWYVVTMVVLSEFLD